MDSGPDQPAGTFEVLGWRDGHIVAIDQTVLPHEIRMLHLTTVDELVDAITRLAVRGAPVLGVAGALGVALAARLAEEQGWDEARLAGAVKRIGDARPTAVNLRRETEATAAVIPDGPAAVEAAALATLAATVTATHRMSERGARYLRDTCGPRPLRIETHCNTGSLACLGWGTALGAIRAGFGIGGCQVGIGRREGWTRLLPDQFALRIEAWVVMHEDLKASTPCRLTFDALVEGLRAYVAGQRA